MLIAHNRTVHLTTGVHCAGRLKHGPNPHTPVEMPVVSPSCRRHHGSLTNSPPPQLVRFGNIDAANVR